MSDLIDTTEMFLRTIFELGEEGVVPLRARIAERLHQSGPTVSQTVARMERAGLLTLHNDRQIELTPTGHQLAMRVMRKHRLAERLLLDVIGLDWELLHDEACRWEHVISEEVERKLVGLLPGALESPYGNPIPGLDELGVDRPVPAFRDGVVPLAQVMPSEGDQGVEVRRLGESIQADSELLTLLAECDVRPGAQIVVRRVAAGVRLEGPHGDACVVESRVADHVFVAGR